jgi:hypothetical protein
LVSLVFNITHGQKAILNNIERSILSIWRKSGTKFTIQYLAECLRLVCVYIAEDGIKNKKTWVSCYCKSGLPKILTFKGSRFIIDYRKAINNGLVLENGVLRFSRLLISYLSFFRMMSPEHVLSFASVTDPLREGSVTLTNRQIRDGLASLDYAV